MNISALRANILAAALEHYLMEVLSDPRGTTERGNQTIELMKFFDEIADFLEGADDL